MVLFLDDGGVMNDNSQRAPQWQKLVGTYLAPRLGGAAESWALANRAVASRLFEDWDRTMRNPLPEYALLWRQYQERWLREMCVEVGVAFPQDEEERVALADATAAYVTRRVQAAYPGVVETIRALHAAGHTLHTSSAEHSRALAGYLEGMGVLSCFGTLYGPDLLGTPKASSRYYARLFAHSGVGLSEALVVDDKETVLNWAAAVGARTVLCSPTPPSSARHRHIACLADLPRLL